MAPKWIIKPSMWLQTVTYYFGGVTFVWDEAGVNNLTWTTFEEFGCESMFLFLLRKFPRRSLTSRFLRWSSKLNPIHEKAYGSIFLVTPIYVPVRVGNTKDVSLLLVMASQCVDIIISGQSPICFSSLRSKQNFHHLAHEIFILLCENCCILIFFAGPPKSSINNKPSLVQNIAWCRTGDKPYLNQQWPNLL